MLFVYFCEMKNAVIVCCLLLIGCNKESNQPVPDIFILVKEFQELDSKNTVSIEVTLSTPYNDALSLPFISIEGSAKNGTDYTSNSGTIDFPAGVIASSFNIEIIGDEHLELTEIFKVLITVDGQDQEFEITIRDDDNYVISRDDDGYITPIEYPSMQLIWNDEFDGDVLNEADWGYNIGNGCAEGICGWGNEELQTYTDLPENVRLENGKLVITAIENPNYTSARVLTEGKREFQFGRIDIRAKMPYGQGIWPALWMLGTDIGTVGWPICGEIDIMELIGNKPTTVHGTVHYDNNGYASKTSTRSLSGNNLADEYHVYSLVWERNSIKWYVDYDEYNFVTQKQIGESYPFNNPSYLLMNIAIGGKWPGDPDETTIFPQKMIVDYIRVFQ